MTSKIEKHGDYYSAAVVNTEGTTIAQATFSTHKDAAAALAKCADAESAVQTAFEWLTDEDAKYFWSLTFSTRADFDSAFKLVLEVASAYKHYDFTAMAYAFDCFLNCNSEGSYYEI